ncbi:MAG: outer membrane protein transport protein [Hydrogenophilaceae bacterium]
MQRMGMVLAGLMLGGGAQAAGFALIEQNASGLGNAYAGQAAVAADASTIFFNPAGLTELPGRQVAGALHLIKPSAEFSGATPDGGDAGSLAMVPSFYYAMDLAKDLKFGLGVGAPFGLKTEYDTDWAGRAGGILSDVKTININPTLAWRVNDKFSVGVGVDYQYIEAELTRAPYPVNHPYYALVATMKGDDTAWGWNLGALFKIAEATRIGVSYRSTMDYRLTGQVTYNLDPTVVPIYADVKLPDVASLALFHQVDDRWSVMADMTWTGWSSFDRLAVMKSDNTGYADTPTDESWKDVWRFAVGATYRQDDQWSWRFGVAYDNTPVPDVAHRTVRIPDEDRTWVAVGGQYRASKQGKVDFGYAHLFVKDAELISPVAGTYDNAVDILSVQYTHTF